MQLNELQLFKNKFQSHAITNNTDNLTDAAIAAAFATPCEKQKHDLSHRVCFFQKCARVSKTRGNIGNGVFFLILCPCNKKLAVKSRVFLCFFLGRPLFCWFYYFCRLCQFCQFCQFFQFFQFCRTHPHTHRHVDTHTPTEPHPHTIGGEEVCSIPSGR